MDRVKMAAALIGLGALLAGAVAVNAQQISQPQLQITPNNRTLAVTGFEQVVADPEVAVLHIGFETQPSDAKKAYADGAQTSNAIIGAIKSAGIAETAIHSETQHLDRIWNQPHKFKLVQQWTVKTTPERAAEILDIAVSAGATSSGDIDWTLNDEKKFEAEALEKAAAAARANAEVLARGMGVKLGALIFTSNQVSGVTIRPMNARIMSAAANAAPPPPLAIEPEKVSREATVYAVFAIE
jgi:hypothetical protein